MYCMELLQGKLPADYPLNQRKLVISPSKLMVQLDITTANDGWKLAIDWKVLDIASGSQRSQYFDDFPELNLHFSFISQHVWRVATQFPILPTWALISPTALTACSPKRHKGILLGSLAFHGSSFFIKIFPSKIEQKTTKPLWKSVNIPFLEIWHDWTRYMERPYRMENRRNHRESSAVGIFIPSSGRKTTHL